MNPNQPPPGPPPGWPNNGQLVLMPVPHEPPQPTLVDSGRTYITKDPATGRPAWVRKKYRQVGSGFGLLSDALLTSSTRPRARTLTRPSVMANYATLPAMQYAIAPSQQATRPAQIQSASVPTTGGTVSTLATTAAPSSALVATAPTQVVPAQPKGTETTVTETHKEASTKNGTTTQTQVTTTQSSGKRKSEAADTLSLSTSIAAYWAEAVAQFLSKVHQGCDG
ncbi:MAG: hypothetical protein M1817_002507 [Caeruleum heppii]|nr:MAG: hypothetical protein M1817_002507 [Caeruleum heppii]